MSRGKVVAGEGRTKGETAGASDLWLISFTQMYDDLKPIADLEYVKAVDRIALEGQEKIRRVQTMHRGGGREDAKLTVQLEQSEEACRVYADIWKDLLEARNGGHLTRIDVNFIVQNVRHLVEVRKSALRSNPNSSRLASAGQRIAMRMESISASIRRDLEIRIRKQIAFPKQAVLTNPPHISVVIQNAANVNLGSQMGMIQATLTAISDRSEEHSRIAAVLKELSEAVLISQQILDSQKQEALEVIADIANQAECKPGARSRGRLKAMIVGLPVLLGVAADVTTLWEKCVPMIKHFFGI